MRKQKKTALDGMSNITSPLIVAVRISNTVPSENSTQPREFKQQDNEKRLNNWRMKKCMGNTLDK